MSSDYDTARRTLARYTRALATRQRTAAQYSRVEFAGDPDAPAWARQCKRDNAISMLQYRIGNLTRLLSSDHTYRPLSAHNVGFLAGDVHIDGDWAADLSMNGTEYCIPCAGTLLLTGDIDPDAMHCCYAYIGEPDYQVECASCGAVIYAHEEEEEEQDAN